MPDPVLTLDSTRVSVAPGSQTSVTVKVANPGTVVEGYRLSVLGDGPSRWAEVVPAEVSLLPKQETTVTVVFSPPSGATAPSGIWPFGVLARSTVDPDGSAVVEGDVEISQVYGMQAKITPVTSAGRWRGRHVVRLNNWGNTPARLKLVASDPDEALGFLIRPDVVDLPVGGSASARIWVRARKPFLRGTPLRLPFTVVGERLDATPSAGPTPFGATPDRPTADGAFNQKPIVSKGFVTLVTLLVVGCVALVGVLFFLREPEELELTPGKPRTPTGLRAEAAGPTSVRLTWDPRPGVDEYEIRVRKNNISQQPQEVPNPAAGSAVVPNLEADSEYCFDLIAIRKDSQGTERGSDPASVCTKTGASPSPSPTPTESASPSPSPSPSPTPTTDPSLSGKYVAVLNAYRPVVPQDRVLAEVAKWEEASFIVRVLDIPPYVLEPPEDNPYPPDANRMLVIGPTVGDESEATNNCEARTDLEIILNGSNINLQCAVFLIVS